MFIWITILQLNELVKFSGFTLLMSKLGFTKLYRVHSVATPA